MDWETESPCPSRLTRSRSSSLIRRLRAPAGRSSWLSLLSPRDTKADLLGSPSRRQMGRGFRTSHEKCQLFCVPIVIALAGVVVEPPPVGGPVRVVRLIAQSTRAASGSSTAPRRARIGSRTRGNHTAQVNRRHPRRHRRLRVGRHYAAARTHRQQCYLSTANTSSPRRSPRPVRMRATRHIRASRQIANGVRACAHAQATRAQHPPNAARR